MFSHLRSCKGKMWSKWCMDWIKLVCVIMSSNKLVCSIAKKLIETSFVVCKLHFHMHYFSGFDCFKIKLVLIKGWMNEWNKAFHLKMFRPSQTSEVSERVKRIAINLILEKEHRICTLLHIYCLLKSSIGPYF